MEKRGRTRLTSSVWWHALERKDKLATKLIERAVEALGAGIASAVNLLDVEAVIIGGGLGVRFGEPYVQLIAQAMRPHLFNDTRPPDVKLAALGDLGGALGAALLAEQAPREPSAAAEPAARNAATPARSAPDAALPAQTQ
jgi:glucokinase